MYQLKITKSFKIDYKKLTKLVYKKTTDKMIYILTCIRISSHTNIFDAKKRQK